MAPFLLVWGVMKGGLVGGWSFWTGGPKFGHACLRIFSTPPGDVIFAALPKLEITLNLAVLLRQHLIAM